MNFKILIVDDNPQNIDLVRKSLEQMGRKDIISLIATSGELAISLYRNNKVDLVLLDVMMPGISGFEVCEEFRKEDDLDALPIIFITAKSDEVARGFEVGGNDYLVKPIDTAELRHRVGLQLTLLETRRSLHEAKENLEQKVRERTAELALVNKQLREEIRERRYIQDRLQYLASHDFVTHLHNRNALEDHVTNLLSRVHLQRSKACYLQVDLDRFKLVNETCGCFAGDELLRQVAELIKSYLNKGDFFARLGGDKFALVCENMNTEQAKELARDLQDQLKIFQFLWDDRVFTISAAFAIADIDKDIASFDHLMMLGDEMLYHLKKDKTQLITYKELSKKSFATGIKVSWAIRLMDGLKKRHFEVWYQKVFDINEQPPSKDYPAFKIEALVRFRDPTHKRLVPPDEFIPSAERFNLISEVDKWMLDNTLRQLSTIPSLNRKIHSIGINLSALTIREANLADYIKDTITKYRIPPAMLCFELTETEAVGNMIGARKFINDLNEFGCKFALDDFGSGFSSFNYLRELPFDYVKIDGVFVVDMDRNESHRAMVKSIVDIASKLDKEVIAEYVGSEKTLSELREFGVRWGQGFYFHKPEPIELLIDHIK